MTQPPRAHLLHSDRDADDPAGAPAPAALALLSACLDVVRQELKRTNRLRETMAAALSHHAGALLDDAEGKQTREAAFGIICALQEDDRIRQRLEGLGEALAIASALVADVAAQAARRADDGRGTARRDWAETLLATQRLDELHRSFAGRLASRALHAARRPGRAKG